MKMNVYYKDNSNYYNLENANNEDYANYHSSNDNKGFAVNHDINHYNLIHDNDVNYIFNTTGDSSNNSNSNNINNDYESDTEVYNREIVMHMSTHSFYCTLIDGQSRLYKNSL